MMKDMWGAAHLSRSSSSSGGNKEPLILELRSTATTTTRSSSPRSFVAIVPQPFLAQSSSNSKNHSNGNHSKTNKRSIEIDPIVATASLGLQERDEVIATPFFGARAASRVFVEPATIDDSEVAEENATWIEMMMLQMVSVVYVGQKIPVSLGSGTRVMLKVTSISFGDDTEQKKQGSQNKNNNNNNNNDDDDDDDDKSQLRSKDSCAILTAGCELVIATKRRKTERQKTSEQQESPTEGKPKKSAAVLRLLPSSSSSSSSSTSTSHHQGDDTTNDANMFMSSATATRLGWIEGDEICVLDLAFWADVLMAGSSTSSSSVSASSPIPSSTSSSSFPSLQSPSSPRNRPGPPPPPSQRDIVSDPFLLRKSARVKISVVDADDRSNEFPLFCARFNSNSSSLIFESSLVKRANVATCLYCWLPSLSDASQQNNNESGSAGGGENRSSSSGASSNRIRAISDVLKAASRLKSTGWPTVFSPSSSSSPSSFSGLGSPFSAAAASAQPIRFASSLPPTMGELKRIHSEETINLISHMLEFSSSDEKITSVVPSKILLSGNRGCSKTAVALRVALDSNRHVIVFECASARADFTKKLPSVLLECILCAPSCLILEDIENVVARERDLAGGPAAVAAPVASQQSLAALEGLLYSVTATLGLEQGCLWFSSNKDDLNIASSFVHNSNNAIAIIATTPDKEMIHPRISRHESGPFGFSFHYRISLPGLEAREELIRQMLNTKHFDYEDEGEGQDQDGEKSHKSQIKMLVTELATETEHFSPGDLTLLFKHGTQKMQQQRDSSSSSFSRSAAAFLQNLIDLVVNRRIIPLALSSVNFLNSSSGSGGRGGGSGSGGGNKSNNKQGEQTKGDASSTSSSTSSWRAVGGLEKARSTLNECIVLPCRYPQIFDKLPLKSRSGVLLYGPSGCGKSYLVACLAAAENLNCIVVNGPEILDKYIGQSEAKVREVFERAQAASPCVLFLDEFDSIAPQRGHDNTGVTDRVVNQLLCYLDGVESRSKVYVVAASSRPDLIDVALLRPGRLDRHVLCGFPSREERREILRAHILNGLPNGDEVLRNVGGQGGQELNRISDELCENWTGADMAALVTSAGVAYSKRMAKKAEREHEERMKEKELMKRNKDNDDRQSTRTKIVDGDDEDDDGEEVLIGVSSALSEKLTKKYLVPANKNFQKRQHDDLLSLLGSKLASLSSSSSKPSTSSKSNNKSQFQHQQHGHEQHHDMITIEDFKEAIKNTRPSCSEKEVRRLNMMYDQFQNRGKRTAAAAAVTDSRVTLA